MEFNNLTDTLTLIGQIASEEYKEKIKRGAYATGNLFNSVKYELDVTEQSIKLSFTNLPDYYLKVEKGQKPNENTLTREFIGKIYKWMLTKKISTKNNGQYYIARSIVNNGVKAKPYLSQIKLTLKNNYVDEIENAIKKDIKEMLKNKIKDGNNNNKQ